MKKTKEFFLFFSSKNHVCNSFDREASPIAFACRIN
jgi:hypothetical protein